MQYDLNDEFRMEMFLVFFFLISLSSVIRLAYFFSNIFNNLRKERTWKILEALNLVDRFSLPLLFCYGEHYLLVVWRSPLNLGVKFS